MSVSIYFNFSGNTHEVLDYYQKIFKTEKPDIMLWGEIPPDENYIVSDEWKNKVMHASIVINGTTLMAADASPGIEVKTGDNISIMLAYDDIDELTRVYKLLAEDGSVISELEKTFWSDAYGYLVDKFGIGWQLILN